jgi:Ulp1 family protease
MIMLQERTNSNATQFPKAHFMDTQFFANLFPLSGPPGPAQTRVYNYDNVKTWMSPAKLTELDLIIIPINDAENKHWILAVVDLQMAEIKFYDSRGGKHKHHMNGLEKYLQDEAKTQKAAPFIGMKWKKTYCTPPAIPIQTDCTSCALFVAANADCISDGREPTGFAQQDMLHFREKLLNLFETHCMLINQPATVQVINVDVSDTNVAELNSETNPIEIKDSAKEPE